MTLWQPGMRITADRLRTFTPTTATAGVVTIASGWTLLAQAGAKVGGITQIFVRLQRTSTALAADSAGNLADTAMFTVNSGWRPNAAFGGERMPFIASDAFGHGSALLTADSGLCDIVTWIPSQSILTDRFLRVLLTYPG
ncbi:hypothetical protein [Streptomyces youssoufiensis]